MSLRTHNAYTLTQIGFIDSGIQGVASHPDGSTFLGLGGCSGSVPKIRFLHPADQNPLCNGEILLAASPSDEFLTGISTWEGCLLLIRFGTLRIRSDQAVQFWEPNYRAKPLRVGGTTIRIFGQPDNPCREELVAIEPGKYIFVGDAHGNFIKYRARARILECNSFCVDELRPRLANMLQPTGKKNRRERGRRILRRA